MTHRRKPPIPLEQRSASASTLILKPSSLGDIVHTLPAAARLKAARPNWRLSWLVNAEWAPLLRDNPDVAEVIEFPRRNFRGIAGGLAAWKWAAENLRGRRPEIALDFQGLLRTALLGRLSGARRLHGLGDAREGSRWFYHRTVPLPTPGQTGRPLHAVERYLALVDDLLGEPRPAAGETSWSSLRFPLPAGDKPGTGQEPPAIFFLLHPFSRGAGKSLTAMQVRAFCDRLAPHQVVVVGKSPDPRLRLALPKNARELVDRTSLLQLLWLLRRAAFTISVDSGPMHLAAALTDRLVGLHAWSDPRRVGPYNPGARVWKAGRLWRVRELAEAPGALMENTATLENNLTLEGIHQICALAQDSA